MVNVNNFDSEIPPIDMLETLMDRQFLLLKKYHTIEEANAGHSLPTIEQMGDSVDVQSHRGQQLIKDYAWRVTEELGEAMNTLKNKPWKQSHIATDETHFREELVDAVHFLLELLLLVGFTPESLTKMYLNKNAVNNFRIRSKY